MAAAELDVALRAAKEAGALLLDHFENGVATEWKGRGDIVTVADREAEALVRTHVAEVFGDPVVGEEGHPPLDEAAVAGRRRWYVDPLDGTTNFVKGRRRWATAIAFVDADDVTRVAVIHVPTAGETFVAVRGEGATRDGQALRVDARLPAEHGLALLGPLDGLEAAVGVIGAATLSLRVTGSTVSDLADVACGRGDLYAGANQGRWDLAAGLLLAAEAGAVVSGFDGSPVEGPRLASYPVLCAAPSVHAALLPALGAL